MTRCGEVVMGCRASALVWLDRTGKSVATIGDTNLYRAFDLSPDGTKLAVQIDTPDGGNAWRAYPYRLRSSC